MPDVPPEIYDWLKGTPLGAAVALLLLYLKGPAARLTQALTSTAASLQVIEHSQQSITERVHHLEEELLEQGPKGEPPVTIAVRALYSWSSASGPEGTTLPKLYVYQAELLKVIERQTALLAGIEERQEKAEQALAALLSEVRQRPRRQA